MTIPFWTERRAAREMFSIDRQSFSREWVASEINRISGQPALRQPFGKLYALCHRQPLHLLLLVLYLKEQGSGVLLIPGDTPYETALTTARQAGADYLSFGELDSFTSLSTGDRTAPEPGLYQYSSGTTGEPKRIRRPWEAIDREIAAYNDRIGGLGTGQPIILVPVSHSFGLIAGTLSAIARGTEPRIVQEQNPKYALRLLRENPSHLLYAVPFQLHLLHSLAKDELRLDQFISSGAPMTELLLSRLRPQSSRIWQQYGCSELGCIALGADPAVPSEVGRPLGHLSVACLPLEDESGGEPLQEIVAVQDGNTVRTRDVGFFDSKGSLHVKGRADDLINVSGFKVLPSEVEAVIGRMNGISEVVVHRARHVLWGEAVQALVVASGEVHEKEIKSHCLRELPKYKVPSVIRLVDEIPKLPSGKISRKQLQELEESL
ncbi:AMP-binding protein [Paenibacillus sp. NPDC058071]|uniref:AMP-binding protein n=1 Tax=Paenibacillus sp. NPDC058071 TaxID=3346326 RepID=UPI0036D9C9E2